MRLHYGVLLVGASALAACFGSDSAEDQSTIGPCIVNYSDPLLTINSVQARDTRSSIKTVELADIRLDGEALELNSLHNDVQSNVQTDTSEGHVLCTPPCALFTEEGQYQFDLVAPGYKTQKVSVVANYDQFAGGCPAIYSGGEQLDLQMTPSSGG